jgi:hypothetical protein
VHAFEFDALPGLCQHRNQSFELHASKRGSNTEVTASAKIELRTCMLASDIELFGFIVHAGS